MPPPEATFRTEPAVVWRAAGYGADGLRTVYEPEEVTVRWVRKVRILPGPDGNLISTDATVVAGCEIPEESLMWRGRLSDWPGTRTGPDGQALFVVTLSEAVPDVKGRVTNYSLTLRKYRDAVPTVVKAPG